MKKKGLYIINYLNEINFLKQSKEGKKRYVLKAKNNAHQSVHKNAKNAKKLGTKKMYNKFENGVIM